MNFSDSSVKYQSVHYLIYNYAEFLRFITYFLFLSIPYKDNENKLITVKIHASNHFVNSLIATNSFTFFLIVPLNPVCFPSCSHSESKAIKTQVHRFWHPYVFCCVIYLFITFSDL